MVQTWQGPDLWRVRDRIDSMPLGTGNDARSFSRTRGPEARGRNMTLDRRRFAKSLSGVTIGNIRAVSRLA